MFLDAAVEAALVTLAFVGLGLVTGLNADARYLPTLSLFFIVLVYAYRSRRVAKLVWGMVATIQGAVLASQEPPLHSAPDEVTLGLRDGSPQEEPTDVREAP